MQTWDEFRWKNITWPICVWWPSSANNDPQSNDENQLTYLLLPAIYTSSSISGQWVSLSPFCILQLLPESQVLTTTIVHQNERIKHQPHIVALQHEVSVPLSPLNYSHSKQCHPYHSSYPHRRSSLFHHSNQSIRLHNDELGLSSLSESFTSNDQDTTSHSIFNATPVTVQSGQMNQTIHLVSKNKVISHFVCPLIILSALLP